MEELNLQQITDEEILTPPIMRLLDRLIDVKYYERKIKVKRFKNDNNRIEILVLLEDENKSKSLTIYEIKYPKKMETLEATLNSPMLARVTNIYDTIELEAIWEKV